ncbi:cytochrome b5 [Rhagoletis pomonella]|uniref:cytochrome b5 n=1 Tax=Rhagoletis pomonella TaxID=28610 RepID=UPI00177ACBDC|nr:cytochrome b5 [Rhagoletis pomonella]
MTSTLSSLLQTLGLNTSSKKAVATPPNTALHKSFPQESSYGVLPHRLPEITLSLVAQHDEYTDCWIVIYDRVYDVTQFLRDHPGGEDIIMEHAGRDATLAFHGTGHSQSAIDQLGEYLIGELPAKERIFRNDNAKVLSIGVPQ